MNQSLNWQSNSPPPPAAGSPTGSELKIYVIVFAILEAYGLISIVGLVWFRHQPEIVVRSLVLTITFVFGWMMIALQVLLLNHLGFPCCFVWALTNCTYLLLFMPGALKLLRLSVLTHHHQHNINLRLTQQKMGNGWEHKEVNTQIEGNSSTSSFTIHIQGITHGHEDDPAMMLRGHLSLTKVNGDPSAQKNQSLMVPSNDVGQTSDLSLFPPLPDDGEPSTQDPWGETRTTSIHPTRISMVSASGIKAGDPSSLRVPRLDLKKVHPITHSNSLQAISAVRVSTGSNVPEKLSAENDNVAIPPEWSTGPEEPPSPADPGVNSPSMGVHWKEQRAEGNSKSVKSRALLRRLFDGYLTWMYRVVISDRTLHWILVGSLAIVVTGVTITALFDPGLRGCRTISTSQHICAGPAIHIWSILDLLMLIPSIPSAVHFLRKKGDHYKLKLETIVILVYNFYMVVWWFIWAVLELPDGSTGLGSTLYITTLIVFVLMVSLFGYYPLLRAYLQLRAAGRLKITPINGSDNSFDQSDQGPDRTSNGNGMARRLMIKRTTIETEENTREELFKPTMSLSDFYRVMNDRQLRASLHKFAASDFSTELLLFFQAYRALVRAARKHFPKASAPKDDLEENPKDPPGKRRRESTDPNKQTSHDRHDLGSLPAISHDRSHFEHSRNGSAPTAADDFAPSEPGKMSRSLSPAGRRSHSFTNVPEPPWWTDFNPASRASKLPHFPVPDTLKDLYLGVYEQFFVRGADQELNVPGRMMNEVRNQFQAGDMWLDIYDTAKNEVMMMLYLNTYSKWVKSLQ